MRIALAQINPTIGDFSGNVASIGRSIELAKAGDATVVVFPELTVCGYPPRDLLDRDSFLTQNRKALEDVLPKTRGITAIVGFVDIEETETGRHIFNAAAILQDGNLTTVIRKRLLPTYDVFDEHRHFKAALPQKPVLIGDTLAGITICEDIWTDPAFQKRAGRYPLDPAKELVDQGAKIILNLSASPYHLGRESERLKLLQSIARKNHVPVFLCNQVGGNDELIFDGNSLAVSADGTFLAAGKPFAEDLVFVDSKDVGDEGHPLPERFHPTHGIENQVTLEQVVKALTLGTQDYVRKCHFTDVLVGLSGGIDSSLVAALAALALSPENVTGVAMPSPYSSQESIDDARELAKNLGIQFQVIPIHDTFASLRNTLKESLTRSGEASDPGRLDLTEQNLQARVRGDILMALSNYTGAMVLSTGNKSEFSVGYCTLYGDMAGGLAVISDVPKLLVYALSRHINRTQKTNLIPERVLTKPPSAELKPDQLDTDNLPPYEDLDPVLKAFIEEERGVEEIVAQGWDRDLVNKVLRLVVNSEYKRRQAPPGLRITTKAFGTGRRIPIAQAFRQ